MAISLVKVEHGENTITYAITFSNEYIGHITYDKKGVKIYITIDKNKVDSINIIGGG